MPAAPPSSPSTRKPHSNLHPSPLLRRRHLDQARLRALTESLRLRLAYAQLKVSHGWHALTIDEVEALYRLRRRAGLAPSPIGATRAESSRSETVSSKDSERTCGSAHSTTSTSLTTPDAESCVPHHDRDRAAPASQTDVMPCPETLTYPGPTAAAVWPDIGVLAGADEEDEAWGGLGALVGWPAVQGGGPGEALLASMNAISPVQSRSLPRTTFDITPCKFNHHHNRTPVSRIRTSSGGGSGKTPVQISPMKQFVLNANNHNNSGGKNRLVFNHHLNHNGIVIGLNGGSLGLDHGTEISLDDLDGMNWN